MQLKAILAAAGAYCAGVLIGLWINVSILCLGDPKFGGCAGIDLYMVVWSAFLSPIFLTAVILLTTEPSGRQLRVAIVAATLVVTFGAMELSWVVLPDAITSLVLANAFGIVGLTATYAATRHRVRMSGARASDAVV